MVCFLALLKVEISHEIPFTSLFLVGSSQSAAVNPVYTEQYVKYCVLCLAPTAKEWLIAQLDHLKTTGIRWYLEGQGTIDPDPVPVNFSDLSIVFVISQSVCCSWWFCFNNRGMLLPNISEHFIHISTIVLLLIMTTLWTWSF